MGIPTPSTAARAGEAKTTVRTFCCRTGWGGITSFGQSSRRGHRMRRTILALAAVVCALAPGSAQKATETELRRAAQWADWVEPDFPFFSSVIDAGPAAAG